MPNTFLVLGPIAFQDFEVPEQVNIGGAQHLAVHRLPGGARVIDALGRDDAEIRFSGIFSGVDATLRARAVDELRALGAAVPLSWDVFFYSVVIKEFHADYHSGHWIPFRLVCTVLRDEAAAVIDTALSIAGSVLSDLGAVATLTVASATALASAQSLMAQPGADTRGTDAHVAAGAALTGMRVDNTAAMSRAEGDLLIAEADPIAALDMASATAERLAKCAIAQAYLGRAAANLSAAGT